MHFGAVRALVLETNLAVHGFDIVVTRPAPDDTPIETRGIWLTPTTDDMPPSSEAGRREAIRILALSLAAVPTVPKGTRIDAPPKAGDADLVWRVDGLAQREADHVRVYVVPSGEPV